MESQEKNRLEQDILKQITTGSYSDETIFQAFQLLEKILQNILSKPQEEKFRSIKKSNATLQKTLFCIKEIEKLLEVLGFKHSEDKLVFTSDDLTNLEHFHVLLQTQVENIRNRHLTKAEREELEKQKLLEERRKQVEAEFRAKEEEEKKLKELMDLDRKEQSKREKAHDSKAEKREFGAHTKTWKDIGVDLNCQTKR